MALVETEPVGLHAMRIWLNRPRALNALNAELMTELYQAFMHLEADPNIWTVVFQGRGGKAFSVGADLRSVAQIGDGQEAQTFSAKGQAIFHAFSQSHLVTMAAIDGYALGGGLELALALDLRLATVSSSMGFPEVGLGLIPGFGGTQRLPQVMGRTRALWMMLSAERVTAQEAERWGLVNWAVADEVLESAIQEKVKVLDQKAPKAMAMVKALAVSEHRSFTEESKGFGELMETNDAKLGMEAFFRRELPHFDGH